MNTGKVAVVTGGTRGIGRAITLALARAGHTVFALYARNREAGDAVAAVAAAEGLAIRCIRADLADAQGFAECVKAIKSEARRVDFVVHSAASGVHRETTELTERHIDWTFRINFFAIHNLLAELLPMMPAGGRIVGLTSIGATRALPHYGAVGASKGALDALFRHYAAELAPRGIAVNLVCPGLVLTDSISSLSQLNELVKVVLGRTPAGRLTTPEDVAQTVLFLTSEGASQIIGQTIVVDGGYALT